MYMYYWLHVVGFSPYYPILCKGDNFCDFMFAFLALQFPSEKGSTLKGKNLFPLGANSQILSF